MVTLRTYVHDPKVSTPVCKFCKQNCKHVPKLHTINILYQYKLVLFLLRKILCCIRFLFFINFTIIQFLLSFRFFINFNHLIFVVFFVFSSQIVNHLIFLCNRVFRFTISVWCLFRVLTSGRGVYPHHSCQD
jgi:hypothetical protein